MMGKVYSLGLVMDKGYNSRMVMDKEYKYRMEKVNKKGLGICSI